ncbi:MAG: metallophosphoesterase family protein [Alistipes finegoldii]
MKNPFIELCGCICPDPADAGAAACRGENGREVPPADTLRTVFFTDIHVTPGNAQDSLFRIAVAEANASDADLVIFGGDLTNMGERPRAGACTDSCRSSASRGSRCRATTKRRGPKAKRTTFRRLFRTCGMRRHPRQVSLSGLCQRAHMKMADGMIQGEDLAWLERQAAAARPASGS